MKYSIGDTETAHDITLLTISVGAMDNNCYLLCTDGHGLLIDAAADAPALLGLVAQADVCLDAVVTTHRHADHQGALEEVLAATGAVHISSEADADALVRPVDIRLSHGDTLSWRGHDLPVGVLRGHTPGCIVLSVKIDGIDHLLVGDNLFPGGIGKTWSPEDFAQLYADVKDYIFGNYPDDAVVLPGHGASTTVGAERPHLEEWIQRGW